MKKLLFIGGTKFIGAMLVDKFLKEKSEVYIFSRSSPKHEGVHYIAGDRNSPKDLEKLKAVIDDKQFDFTYDMCCYTPIQARQIADMLVTRTKHLVFFSSAAVYAKTETFPLKESASLGIHPSFGDYGTNKAAIEEIYRSECEKRSVGLTIFRPHYILGVDDYFTRHQYFFSRLAKNMPLQVPGNGKALLQFAYAPDVASLFHIVPSKQSSNLEILNIATPEMFTLVGVIDTFAKAAKKKSVTQHVNYELYERNEQYFYDGLFPFPNLNLVLDVSRATEVYGFRGTALATYIDNLFEDWQQRKANYHILGSPF